MCVSGAEISVVPATTPRFYEPNQESGTHVRWAIGIRDASEFTVAGLWRVWADEDGGTRTRSSN